MTETNYYYDANNRLIMEKIVNRTNKFYYDSTGTLVSIEIDGVMLYYIRDIANNIIGLVDSNNQLVAKYSYDAFGNVLTKEGAYATKNPFLYKGYYYEHSMGLYYLESRYYDPRIRRFISPDNIDYLEPTSFNGLNLYAYCGNDPVNYYDPCGNLFITAAITAALASWGIWAIVGIVSSAVVLGGTAQLISNALAGKTGKDMWEGVIGAALGSGANALALLCLPSFLGNAALATAAAIGAAVQTSIDSIEALILEKNITFSDAMESFTFNFLATFAGNWIGSKLIPINSGQYKPQKLLSVFIKPYGQKVLMQTAIGAGISSVANFVSKFNWESYFNHEMNPKIPVPSTPFYQYY